MINKSVVFIAIIFLITTASLTNAQRNASIDRCVTPSREAASCIELEQCTFLYNMLFKRPLPNEDRRFLRRSQCGLLNGKVLVCCPERYMRVPQAQLTARALLPDTESCRNEISNRIFGGNVTKINEFPWMVLIEYDKGGGEFGHHCGGSLINNRYVLTAAHCIRSTFIPETWKPVRVRLGEWDTSTDRDCEVDMSGLQECAEPHIDIPIAQAITHSNYASSAKNQLYDIALLRLSRTVTYTDYIRPICLPLKDSLTTASLDGVAMDVAGWGRTEQGRASNLKLRAEVPGVPLEDCRRVYSKQSVTLENSQMCAGGQKGIDSCNGDSGGALVALDASNSSEVYYYIAGVISFGPSPCGLEGWPGIYTKVSSYIYWILQNIQA